MIISTKLSQYRSREDTGVSLDAGVFHGLTVINYKRRSGRLKATVSCWSRLRREPLLSLLRRPVAL